MGAPEMKNSPGDAEPQVWGYVKGENKKEKEKDEEKIFFFFT